MQTLKKSDIGDISVWKDLLSEQEQVRFYSRRENDYVNQEFTDPSGEIPRTDRYRYSLSSEICRSDHEPGQQESIYQTFSDPQRDP